MARILGRLRDKLLGPKLRTYGEAREELGGVPWRKFQDTARWFLSTPRQVPPPLPSAPVVASKPILIDTEATSTPSRRWKVVSVAALSLGVFAVFSSGGESAMATVSTVVVPPLVEASRPAPARRSTTAAAPVPTPKATAPGHKAVGHPHKRSKMFASVRTHQRGKSPRGVARPTRLKKTRRG